MATVIASQTEFVRAEAVKSTLGPDREQSPPGQAAWWRPLHRIARGIGSATEWTFGLLSLILGLSLMATIPILQLASLGYLLEASSRVAQTGRIRDGLIGIRRAARVGSIVLGTWLVLWPTRAAMGLWYTSLLVQGPNRVTQAWRVALVVLATVTLWHVAWACFRGGRVRDFLWPAPWRFWRRFRAGGMWREGIHQAWQLVVNLRIPYYFQLGVQGFLGALAWLALPITLLIAASRIPVPLGLFSGLAGAILLAFVLRYLPFLQIQFAISRQWRDLLAIRTVRHIFQRAPLACWISLSMTLALALPLYLLKAELVPREAAWLPSLMFVLFTFPARLLTGWAISRGTRRDLPRHFLVRWMTRLAVIPVIFFYILVVYFTQYVSWYGGLSLYEQHAFLLPVPFVGM